MPRKTKKKTTTKRAISNLALTSEVVQVTPELAELLLSNTGEDANLRKLSPTLVQRYARAMRQGNWELTGDSIKLEAGTDALVDGQHRLAAVIESGVTVPMLVVSGVDAAAMIYCNVGRPKKFSQVLSKRGVKYAGLCASICRMVVHRNAVGSFAALYLPDGRIYTPSPAEQQLFYDKHKGAVNDSAEAASRLAKVLPQAVPATIHYFAKSRNRAIADDWLAGLAEGTDLGNLDPRYRLRERGFRQRAQHQGWPQRAYAALVIKCWNLYLTETPCKQLMWRGDHGEDFPEPIWPGRDDDIPTSLSE
jgi:hypothetical protein